MKAPEPVRPASADAHQARSIEAMLKAVGVPVAIAVAAAIWFMPTPTGLSLPGQKALALFGGIFVLYLTEALPLAISSLLVVPAAALGGVVSLRNALEGFSSSSVYLETMRAGYPEHVATAGPAQHLLDLADAIDGVGGQLEHAAILRGERRRAFRRERPTSLKSPSARAQG